ncbi:MAG: hypothetical protein WCX73_05945, partial [Candidatus Pacearchaeota archaeon]
QQIQDDILNIRGMLEQIRRYFKNQLNLDTLDKDYTDNKILSFLSYVFSKENYSKVNHEVINKWFWNTIIFNRFPGAQLQRIESDIKEYLKGEDKFLQHLKKDRSMNILNDEYPLNNLNLINAGYDHQNNTYLSIILLLNSLSPKDFNGKDKINLTDYIGSSTKNNKHHIIPYNSEAAKKIRNKYKNNKFPEFILNNISNIAIISNELNQEIKKKDPKDYFKKYEGNKDFYEILDTHLIDKEMYSDLKNERYEDFLMKRTSKILKIISKKCQINEELLEFNDNLEEENGN